MDSVAHACLVRTGPASPPAQLESWPRLAQCVWLNTRWPVLYMSRTTCWAPMLL